MQEKKFKLHYQGSMFWLIFWVICCFPVALALVLTGSTFKVNQTTFKFKYDASRFWLCFWVLVCFPIAIVLLFLNGFSARTEKAPDASQPLLF